MKILNECWFSFTNRIVIKEAKRSSNDGLKHLIVQLNRCDQAHDEKVQRTNHGEQKHATDENGINVDPSVCIYFFLPRERIDVFDRPNW